MVWRVEYTDEFGEWWETLELDKQEDISASVELLRPVDNYRAATTPAIR